jgi:hypothetical protein
MKRSRCAGAAISSCRKSGRLISKKAVSRSGKRSTGSTTACSSHFRYADLGKASRQIDTVKGKISAYHIGLKDLRRERHDAIKACFLGAGGHILVGDHAVADATQGHCKILALDPARIASGEAIEFSGALDIVTFVDRRDYQL